MLVFFFAEEKESWMEVAGLSFPLSLGLAGEGIMSESQSGHRIVWRFCLLIAAQKVEDCGEISWR